MTNDERTGALEMHFVKTSSSSVIRHTPAVLRNICFDHCGKLNKMSPSNPPHEDLAGHFCGVSFPKSIRRETVLSAPESVIQQIQNH